MNLETRFENFNIKDFDKLITEGQEENLYLEFKTVNNGTLNTIDDKKNYAKVLSGFANSAGGIVVWGIDARKNDSGVDCAIASKPIEEINLFYSRLIELESEAVTPRIEGIKHRYFELENGNGFAITLVPESISGPHMAKLGEYRYYKRSGDTFYKMEHFDIADMFGRRNKPDLDLAIHVSGKGGNSQIVLGIENSGRGSSKAPYMAFIVPKPFAVSPYGVDGNGATGLPRISTRGNKPWIQYGGNSHFVIHPNVILDVTALFIGLGNNLPDPPKDGVTIKYRLASEDFQLIEGDKHIDFEF